MFLAELLSEVGPEAEVPSVLERLRQSVAGTPSERNALYEIERVEAKLLRS
jgi:hypothetical protein